VTTHINVFISHSWAHTHHYRKLCQWFGGDWEEGVGLSVEFLNNSVPVTDPIHYARTTEQLRNAIWKRIAGSHVVVIPTGMYATNSDWIQSEIDGAKISGKPILAVDPRGQQRTSSVVIEAADEFSKWRKDSVVPEAFRLAVNFDRGFRF